MVVFLVLVLGGLSFAFLEEGLAEKASVDMRHNSLLAMQIAEKGVVESSMEVFSQKDAGDDGVGQVSGSYAGGTYAVTAAQDPNDADRWTLSARGTHGLSTRRLEVGLRRRAGGEFVEGLFAKDTLTLNGKNATDAYDSRLGSYAAQAVNSDGSGTYALGGGDIGSNGDIVLHGSSITVRGNAIPGPLHQTSTSGNPTVWGDVLPRKTEIDLQPATLAEFQAAFANNDNDQLLSGGAGTPGNGGNGNNGNGNGNGNGKGNGNGGGSTGGGTATQGSGAYNPTTYALTASGHDVVQLAGGTYFFTDVVLSGQAQLVVNGPSTIYVTGDFDVSGGGFVNGTGLPSDLHVYAHPYPIVPGHNPTASHVKIRGGSNAAMSLYAPGAELSVAGNDDLYGSFVANTITVSGNSRFHYDKALRDVEGHGFALIERLYWRDLDERLR
jgi:hypothetical protein